MLGRFGEALFWTKAIAGVWMVAGTTVYGGDMYAWLRDWVFGPPVKPPVALAAPADARCPPRAVPRPGEDDILRIADFELGPDGQIDPAQYTNPVTGTAYVSVVVTSREGGAPQNVTATTYYLLPEEIVFLPQMLEAKSDSAPYVSNALYASLGQLACVSAQSNGQVRINKALLSVPRQRYWELDCGILADGLGITSVHLQIVDTESEKRTPWDEALVDAAVAKARLAVPDAQRYRAYVRLRT